MKRLVLKVGVRLLLSYLFKNIFCLFFRLSRGIFESTTKKGSLQTADCCLDCGLRIWGGNPLIRVVSHNFSFDDSLVGFLFDFGQPDTEHFSHYFLETQTDSFSRFCGHCVGQHAVFLLRHIEAEFLIEKSRLTTANL